MEQLGRTPKIQVQRYRLEEPTVKVFKQKPLRIGCSRCVAGLKHRVHRDPILWWWVRLSWGRGRLLVGEPRLW